MAELRKVTKQLIGAEDIVDGIGKVTQSRGGNDLPITKLNVSRFRKY